MRTILVPTDFSTGAEAAETEAISLLRDLGGELIVFHAAVEPALYNEGFFGLAEPEKVFAAQRDWAERALGQKVDVIRAQGIRARWVLREGVAHEAIVQAASDERADLIVMGTHGYRGLDRLLLGSVADRVVRTARCPVMVVREGASRARPRPEEPPAHRTS